MESTHTVSSNLIDTETSFSSFNLDDRLVKAVYKLGFQNPSLVQSAAIPLALQGKDIAAKARTGSGKTAAYCLPILQNWLNLIVGTPSRVLKLLKEKRITLDQLQNLVVDEADQLISFGYVNDLQTLVRFFPPIYQAFLMSATLSVDVDMLKKLMLHTPAVLKLEEAATEVEGLIKEYYLPCSEQDKFLIVYAFLRLKIIPGKAIFFVSTLDQAYKLKLFLHRFSIPSVVLNAQLPLNSRQNTIQTFNKGIVDYLIAVEESQEDTDKLKEKKKSKVSEETEKKVETDSEFGAVRGVDFKGVQTIVNFDYPPSVASYIHRIGRTARGGARGSALTLVTPTEESLLEELKGERSEADALLSPYNFNPKAVEGLRYRVENMLRDISKKAIRQARVDALQAEILTSQQIQNHFDSDAPELRLLTQRPVTAVKATPPLQFLPEYLLPKGHASQTTTQKVKRTRRVVDPLRKGHKNKKQKN